MADATHFASNEDYLASELARVQARARGWLAARAEGSLGALLALVERQRAERLQVREQRRQSVEAGVAIPFELIVRRFGLMPIEEDLLWLALSPHLSANTRELLLHAQGEPARDYLELGFVADLVHPTRDLRSFRAWGDADGRLVRRGLILVEAPPERRASRLAAAVQTPHHVAAAVAGEIVVDERLHECVTLREPRVELFDVVLAPSTRRQLERFIDSVHGHGVAQRRTAHELGWTLLVSGGAQLGKTSLCEALAKLREQPLFTLSCQRIEEPGRAASLLELARHNARFVGAVWHIEQPEALVRLQPQLLVRLRHLVDGFGGVVLLETDDPDALDAALTASIDAAIDLTAPDAVAREQIWESRIPHAAHVEADVDLASLAGTFDLSCGQIGQAVAWAARRAAVHGRAGHLRQEDLERGARSQLRSKLGRLTAESQAQVRLRDLVLPPEELERVRELLEACRNRQRLLNDWGFGRSLVTGRGLVALFAGAAGTGKTLCAEIFANELGQRLHIVQISKIVSKWVGETSRNVREVFAEARAQNAMLLFDEADALFGKRVKVEKSQDHFLNMEVNNLLQEIERFDGIVLLTTNLEANMDDAFARRILFKIDFPEPAPEQREAIWQRLIPPAAPRADDLDFARLAERYELTGGRIENAVLRAAYQCLALDRSLDQRALEDAAFFEARAAGKLLRRPEHLEPRAA